MYGRARERECEAGSRLVRARACRLCQQLLAPEREHDAAQALVVAVAARRAHAAAQRMLTGACSTQPPRGRGYHAPHQPRQQLVAAGGFGVQRARRVKRHCERSLASEQVRGRLSGRHWAALRALAAGLLGRASWGSNLEGPEPDSTVCGTLLPRRRYRRTFDVALCVCGGPLAEQQPGGAKPREGSGARARAVPKEERAASHARGGRSPKADRHRRNRRRRRQRGGSGAAATGGAAAPPLSTSCAQTRGPSPPPSGSGRGRTWSWCR